MFKSFNKNALVTKEVSLLAVFAVIVIPLGTYLFATNESPLHYTMSKMGNEKGYRLGFIIWGIVTGLSLSFFVIRLYVLKSFRNPRSRKLFIWSMVFLLLAVVIPSLEHLPLLGKLHNFSAGAFGVLLMASLYLFVNHIEERNPKTHRWSIIMIKIIVGGSLLVLFLFGLNAIFQLFFFFSLSFFLWFINRRLAGQKERLNQKAHA